MVTTEKDFDYENKIAKFVAFRFQPAISFLLHLDVIKFQWTAVAVSNSKIIITTSY